MSETGPTGPTAAPPDEAAEEAVYATLLEEVFIAERGTPFLLSPKDWLLIRGWRKSGIPADTAVRAIRETFERRRARGQAGKISSLAYCENAVEERWELERRGLVGRHTGTPDPSEPPGPRLVRLAEALEGAAPRETEGVEIDPFRKAVLRAAEKVRALDASRAIDELEEELSAVEGSLHRSLVKALLPETKVRLEARASELLGEPGDVSEEVRERTRRALFRREVRRALSLPPLTLFDV